MGTVQVISRSRDGVRCRLWTSAGGRRRSRYVVADGKRHALELLAEWERDLRRGERPPARSGATTVHRLCTDWLAQHEQLTVAARRGYDTCVRRIERAPLGSMQLHLVDYDAVSGQERAWIAGGLSASSVRQCHAVLRQAFRWAVIRGLLVQSPVDLVRPPRLPQTDVSPPAASVLRDCMVAALEHRHAELAHALVVLAAATGCRRGELCALRWDDLDGAELNVARSIADKPGGGWVMGPTKTRSVRTIPIDDGTVELLVARRAWQASMAIELEVPATPWILGDPSADGPCLPARATHIWESVRRRVPAAAAVRLHDLRHWHATMLLDAGQSIPAVAEQMGHASGLTTVKVYAHATRRAVALHREIIGAALRS